MTATGHELHCFCFIIVFYFPSLCPLAVVNETFASSTGILDNTEGDGCPSAYKGPTDLVPSAQRSNGFLVWSLVIILARKLDADEQ